MKDKATKYDKKGVGNVNNKVIIDPELKTHIQEELLLEFDDLTDEDNLIIDEFLEDLSVASRTKKKQLMKRMKNRIKIAKKRQLVRVANTKTLEKRARKSAIDLVKKKLSPNYKDSSAGEKNRVERLAKRKAKFVDRLAKRNVKDKRKLDRQRLSSSQVFKGDELIETLNTLYDTITKE